MWLVSSYFLAYKNSFSLVMFEGNCRNYSSSIKGYCMLGIYYGDQRGSDGGDIAHAALLQEQNQLI